MKTFNLLLLLASFGAAYCLIYVGEPITIGTAFVIMIGGAIYCTTATAVNTNVAVEHKDKPTITETYQDLTKPQADIKTALSDILN
tara:strand:+ start:444 stop:701 length:258 start_codon:yes stop_codon:yes gene_type:complete